jgi:hypothetical protein
MIKARNKDYKFTNFSRFSAMSPSPRITVVTLCSINGKDVLRDVRGATHVRLAD